MAPSKASVAPTEESGKATPEQAPAQKKQKKPPTLASALSGAISGSLISACVQPLDVVRTKMQADAARGIVRSTLATARVVLTEQGLRGFWAGTGPSVIRVGLGAGLHFVLLEQIRAALTTTTAEGGSHLSNASAAVSGGVSRAIAAILLCPVTVVKTRMEYVADVGSTTSAAAATGGAAGATGAAGTAGAAAARAASGAATSTSGAAGAAGAAGGAAAAAARRAGAAVVPVYRDTFHALSTIVKTEGVRGLFRGVWPTVLTNAPYSGLYYMFYTRLKESLSGEDRPQALVNFTSGVVAAVASTLLTQPADVVRTRIQLGLGVGATAAAAATTTTTATAGAAAGSAAAGAGAAAAGAGASAWGTLLTAVRQQGPSALMTGAAPRILKRTTQTALVWTMYEELVPRITQLGLAAKAAWEERAAAQQQQQQQQPKR
ncbi:hypothetical protein HYH02_007307 [Chlamydomonas schloesseri]|uniref:Mitochondrial carrier protein n=1 Tax=Chlamydomonas schloesseri TaxID=2026947 RepID=A0A835WI49_9CHLO|nr:hypothetical protein HYH02_007307 [Chlamydomonas schloesseri]|eukprot:KAG2447851.1 hypothetical protein HYH02_007307 [Chlamydomonas schloesseri]